MLNIMEGHYKNLRENGQPPEHFRRLVIDALSTGPNYLFNDLVCQITEDVDSGIGSNANITPDSLIIACWTKYNNMAENKDWHKVNPREAQILVLTTIMENTMTKSGGTVLVTKADAYKDKTTNDEFINGLERWRTVKTDKTKVVKGRTYYWCPNMSKRECGTACMLLTNLRTIKGKVKILRRLLLRLLKEPIEQLRRVTSQMATPPFN